MMARSQLPEHIPQLLRDELFPDDLDRLQLYLTQPQPLDAGDERI